MNEEKELKVGLSMNIERDLVLGDEPFNYIQSLVEEYVSEVDRALKREYSRVQEEGYSKIELVEITSFFDIEEQLDKIFKYFDAEAIIAVMMSISFNSLQFKTYYRK